MRKLRTFVAALLLVPLLTSNAGAFSTDNDGGLDPARPKSTWCYYYWNGQLFLYPC